MNRFRIARTGPLFQALALSLSLMMACFGCAGTVVQIRPPYAQKVQIGDGVKITTQDNAVHTGRVVYLDRSVVVLRTPRQTISEHPVPTARYGTTIQWSVVKTVKVAGTLDNRGRLISNEEIRVNTRTHNQRNFLVNFGLLGAAASFLAGVRVQDSMWPATSVAPVGSAGKARIAFWTTWVGGTAVSSLLGAWLGRRWDRRQAIERVERARASRLRVLENPPQVEKTPSQPTHVPENW